MELGRHARLKIWFLKNTGSSPVMSIKIISVIYKIKYGSASKQSKRLFIKTFLKLIFKYNIAHTSFLIQKKNQSLSKKFTVIRSPHVHKHSREQFEFYINKKEFFFHTFQDKKFLIVFKLLKLILFSNIFFKIYVFLNFYYERNLKILLFNPNKFEMKNFFFFNIYLQIWAVYGNLYFNKKLIK